MRIVWYTLKLGLIRCKLLKEAMAKQMLPMTAADADCTVYAEVGPKTAQNYWTRQWPNTCFPRQPPMRIVWYTLKLGLIRCKLLKEAMAEPMLPRTAADADCTAYAEVGPHQTQNY